MNTAHQRYRLARKVTLVGGLVNVLLSVAKIVIGHLGHSQALLADGIHSLSDLATDVLVIFASRYGSQAADDDHPYGHRRIETAVTVILAVLLMSVGLGIIAQAIWGTTHTSTLVKPDVIVLFVALFSLVMKEWLYHYTLAAAKKIESNLLRANAWHHRTDAASSLIVLFGIIGALLGFVILDAIAAILVGGFIIHAAWRLGWKNIRELIDTGVDEEKIAAISDAINSVSGVKTLHQLRTRSMGGKILLDVHILVDPHVSVSEGHYIGDQVHLKLIHNVQDVIDVVVHVDPEDDEENLACQKLPSREELLKMLATHWQDIKPMPTSEMIKLHYLNGKIHIELIVAAELFESEQAKIQFNQALQDSIKEFDFIESIICLVEV